VLNRDAFHEQSSIPKESLWSKLLVVQAIVESQNCSRLGFVGASGSQDFILNKVHIIDSALQRLVFLCHPCQSYKPLPCNYRKKTLSTVIGLEPSREAKTIFQSIKRNAKAQNPYSFPIIF
jgi:hypothetical protein